MPAGISVPLILMQFLESWPKRKRRPFPIVQRRRRRAGSTAGFTGAKALPALRRDDRLGDKGFGVRGKNVAVSEDDQGVHIRARYSMDVNYEYLSENDIHIDAKFLKN